jgi:hypothetical protein
VPADHINLCAIRPDLLRLNERWRCRWIRTMC